MQPKKSETSEVVHVRLSKAAANHLRARAARLGDRLGPYCKGILERVACQPNAGCTCPLCTENRELREALRRGQWGK